MLRNLALLVLPVALLIGCSNNTKPTKAPLPDSSRKQILVKQARIEIPLTDSAKLLAQVDSLAKTIFPLEISEDIHTTPTTSIDLSDFKTKKLFNLPYKRIPRVIGGAGIDDDRIDSTFSLCDTNYKASWVLVTKTPKFLVVQVNGMLVTMDYHLNIIDAILVCVEDPSSNEHFHGDLNSTLYASLKIIMHYNYYQIAGKEDNYRTENEINEDDIWRIDRTGHFKAIRYRPNGDPNSSI
jgi:hypothetical protein